MTILSRDIKIIFIKNKKMTKINFIKKVKKYLYSYFIDIYK